MRQRQDHHPLAESCRCWSCRWSLSSSEAWRSRR